MFASKVHASLCHVPSKLCLVVSTVKSLRALERLTVSLSMCLEDAFLKFFLFGNSKYRILKLVSGLWKPVSGSRPVLP